MREIVTAETSYTLKSRTCSVKFTGKIEVTRSKMKISEQNVALESDIEKTLRSQCFSVPYATPSITPTFVGGFLKFESIDQINLSRNTKVNGQPVVLEGEVKAIFNKSAPATNARTGALDPAPFHLCTFQLKPSHRKASSK